MRSVTPENVQECLQDMGLDFFKYNKFKAQLQKHQCINMLYKIRDLYELQLTNIINQHISSVIKLSLTVYPYMMYSEASARSEHF